MPCCLSCFERDIEDLEKDYYKICKKCDDTYNKVLKLETIIQELRHNNEILVNEYTRLKIEYNNFFKTYYNEIEKQKK